MSEEKTDDTIHFGRKEITPAEDANYRKRIEEAKARNPLNKLKGSTPLGHVERPTMPILDRAVLSGEDPGAVSNMGEPGVVPRPPGSPVLQPQTAHQIQQFAKAQADAQVQSQEAAKDGAKKDDEENIFELFDFSGRQRTEAERILHNKKRREEIEKRCSPMDFEDLIMKNEVRQTIVVIPEKFTCVMRSVTEHENLFLKAFMAKNMAINPKRTDDKKDPPAEPTGDQYVLEKFALAQLALSIVSINGKELPTHLDQNGEPDEKQFLSKLRYMSKMSGYIIADLGVQSEWFDLRVRKLLNPEALGNG